MTSHSDNGAEQVAGTMLLGTASLQPTGARGSPFLCPVCASTHGDTVILVSFDASRFPLEEYCLHAAHADDTRPYTFPNFRFDTKPPGIRVGPWPGWRGVPNMPSAIIRTEDTDVELQFQFWGDEFNQRIIRAVARVKSFRSQEMSVTVSDPRLTPLEAAFYEIRPLKPLPVDLEIREQELQRHPRLLIDDQQLHGLKKNRTGEQGEILQRVFDLLDAWDRTLITTAESKIPAGPESLTPEDRLLVSAFLALINPSNANKNRATSSLLEYVKLTREPGFAPLTIDTQSGETLFMLCMGYDWLFPCLSLEQEQIVRTRLWEIAEICWGHLGYDRDDYAQAHYLGCGMGLLAFSMLFWDNHPRAREWGSHLAGVLKLVLSVLPPDGFFPHGINLWIYEFGFLLRWLELLRTGADLNYWPDIAEPGNASSFRAASTSPDGMYGITFGDPQFRVGGDAWCHYLISSRTGSRKARSIGDQLRDLPVEGVDFRNAPARRRVYECLWFPAEVRPEISQEAVRIFPDGTQVFARTADSLFTFRAGPPLGRHRYESGIPGGYGHSDPCSGSFLLYCGGTVAIAGPGPVYRRDTHLQNIVTINGQGQIGDSVVWLPDFLPPSALASQPEIKVDGSTLSATVELSRAYLPHLAVQSIRRSILVEPGVCVLGADHVLVAKDSSIEWNIHSWGEFCRREGANGAWFDIRHEGKRIASVVCTSSVGSTWQTGISEFVPAYPHDGTRDSYLRIGSHGFEATFFWCIVLTGGIPNITVHDEKTATWLFENGISARFDGLWISK